MKKLLDEKTVIRQTHTKKNVTNYDEYVMISYDSTIVDYVIFVLS